MIRTNVCKNARFFYIIKHKSFWNTRRIVIRKRILELMNKGEWFEAACRAAGIDPATGRRWRQRDRVFNLQVLDLRIMKKYKPLVEKWEKKVRQLEKQAGWLKVVEKD